MKNTTFLKMSEEVAERFKNLFNTADFQKEMASLKEAGSEDNGTFRMVISTDDVDRHGEVVSQDGWILENYLKNPVVLWGHESYSIPVGITDKLSIEIVNGKKQLVAEGRFAGHEFAQTIRKLYDAGMLKASSVGFIPMEYEGNTITKAELLEWSFVSIPANPYALDAAKSAGLDIEMLMSKGFLKDIKDVKEGDDIVTGEEEEKKDEEEVAPTADDAVEDGEVDEATVTNSDDEKSMTLTLVDGTNKKFKLTPKFFEGFQKLIEAEAQKAGRVLSKANLEKIVNAKEALEAVIELASSQEDEGKSIDESERDNKAQDDLQEAEDFLKLRKGVQGIATQLGDILADAKAIAIKKGIDARK